MLTFASGAVFVADDFSTKPRDRYANLILYAFFKLLFLRLQTLLFLLVSVATWQRLPGSSYT